MRQMYGESFYREMAVHARNYLQLQKVRMATDARIRMLKKEANEKGEQPDAAILSLRLQYRKMLFDDEKKALKMAHDVMKDHPLWTWCEGVKGMGPVAGLTIIGFINPYKATTAGHAKAYLGLIPSKEDATVCMKMTSGEQANFNPFAKARVIQVAEKVVMAKDPYYYPLYLKKKRYYMEERGMAAYLEDPTLCPRYDECAKKLVAAAKREGRKPKPPACKGHIDAMAKRWLAELIVSHGLEIMRETEGFDIEVFKLHRGYIPPIRA